MDSEGRRVEDLVIDPESNPRLAEVLARAPKATPEQCARIAELLRPDSRLRQQVEADERRRSDAKAGEAS